MLWGLFGEKKGSQNILIIDIGSASVGAGLVRVSRKGTPELLLVHRTAITVRGSLSASRLADGTIAALRDVAVKAQKTAALFTEGGRVAPQRIDSVACVFASPWYQSKPKLLRIHRDTMFSLSRALIAKILKDEAGLISKEAPKGSMEDSMGRELMERLILSVFLNGYETKSIYADGVESAELGLYMSFMPKEFSKRIRTELEKVFISRPLTFHSFPLIFYLAIRMLAPNLSRALLVDVAGEVTDIILIEGGMIRGISSFPHGKHTLRRGIMAGSPGEGETLLRLHAKGDTYLGRKEVTTGISTGMKNWSIEFQKAVTTLLDGATMPRFVYCVADDHVLPLYVRAINEEPLGVVFSGDGRSVVGITPSLLTGKCRLHGSVTFPDSFLMLAGIVADSFFDRDESLDFLSTNVVLQA